MNSIFDKLKSAYKLKSDADLAYKLNINQSTLSMQKKRGSIDIQAIINHCSDLDFNWLFKVGTSLSEPFTAAESYSTDAEKMLEELTIIKLQNEELLKQILELKSDNNNL